MFKDIFREQLSSLGYYTTYYDVTSVGNAPQYCLIFATYNDRIFKIHQAMETKIKELQKKKWIKEIYKIKYLIQTLPKGQTTL